VTFLTVGFSHLSRLRKDHRFGYGAHRESGRVLRLAEDLDSYVWFTPFHPISKLPRPLATAMTPLFSRYSALDMPGVESAITSANLLVIESSTALMLVPRFRKWNPTARLVYRVSDDLSALRSHAVVRAAEARALPEFDLVSVPSEAIRKRLADKNPTVILHHHGIDKTLFDAATESPYPERGTTAIFVGTAYLDREFIRVAATELPSWSFHVVGPFAGFAKLRNVMVHGELPFAETVPYITHADIGLATWSWVPNPEVYSDSLKIIQYTYARLPIVAPDYVRAERPNVIAYHSADRLSIRSALERAAAFDRSTVSRDGIQSWDELAGELAGGTPTSS